MSNIKISLVILTYNDEKSIGRCIQSVPFASDVLVLDSGSTDRTVQIARQLGARVMVESWRGFFKQKVRATALALNDWVLFLDAGEALSSELADEMKKLVDSDFTKVSAYEIPRLSFYMGRWIRHGGWYPSYHTRFFQRKQVQWVEAWPYEKIEAANTKRLQFPIHYWGYDSIEAHISALNRRTSEQVSGDESNQLARVSVLGLIWGVASEFVSSYWRKGGFREGFPGLVVAMMTAFSFFILRAKSWERKHVKKS